MAGTPFTLTVLGASPACPNPGGSCSGYLVRHGGAHVLLDCGSGVVGRLREHVEPGELDAVLISHFHADHYFDLVPLYYGVRFGASRPGGGRVLVYVPPGGREYVQRLGRLATGRPAMFDDCFDIRDYEPGRPYALAGLSVSLHRVQHYIPSYAMRLEAPDGRVLVFSGDVAPCSAIVDAARDADLFLCEAALVSQSDDSPDPSRRGHLSAGEAGAIAQQAGCERLVLTHYRSHLRERQQAEAVASFGRPVEMAEEGSQYTV